MALEDFQRYVEQNGPKSFIGKTWNFWLLILLIVLKLTEVVTWSWWIVTLPISIPFAIGAIIGFVAGIKEAVDELNK